MKTIKTDCKVCNTTQRITMLGPRICEQCTRDANCGWARQAKHDAAEVPPPTPTGGPAAALDAKAA